MSYITDPRSRYDGPDFDEYCIREGRYLPAARDRTACITCPLSNLCQAGFEEQVARAVRGEDPSLTSACTLGTDDLTAEHVLEGLTSEQVAFVREHITFPETLKGDF